MSGIIQINVLAASFSVRPTGSFFSSGVSRRVWFGVFFPPDTIFHRSGDASSVFLIVRYVASLAYGEMAGIEKLINVLKVTLPPT